MNFKNYIIEFLSLQSVKIEDFKHSKKKLTLGVKVRQKRYECFCRHNDLQFDFIKEWVLKELKAPPIGIYQKVTIKFWLMRGKYSDCNCPSVAEVSWIHSKFKSMSYGFAETAGRLMREITCEAVIRVLHTDSKLMWKLHQHRINVMIQFMKLPEDLGLSYLAADKVHFRTIFDKNRKGLFTRRRKPKFITSLVAPLHGIWLALKFSNKEF